MKIDVKMMWFLFRHRNFTSEVVFTNSIPPLGLTPESALQCIYLPQNQYLSIALVTPTLPNGVSVSYQWDLTMGELLGPCR
jgi:hypothetical protein